MLISLGKEKPLGPLIFPENLILQKISPFNIIFTYCCCSVAKSCLTLCHPMGYSMPGFPVPHYLLEFAQTHVQWVSDAIQPSHPMLSPSPPAINLSQHQDLFQSQFFTAGGQTIGASASASVLPMNIQGWFPFGLTCLIFLSPRDSQESFLVPQFKSINSSVLSLLYGPTLTSIGDYYGFPSRDFCWQSDV